MGAHLTMRTLVLASTILGFTHQCQCQYLAPPTSLSAWVLRCCSQTASWVGTQPHPPAGQLQLQGPQGPETRDLRTQHHSPVGQHKPQGWLGFSPTHQLVNTSPGTLGLQPQPQEGRYQPWDQHDSTTSCVKTQPTHQHDSTNTSNPSSAASHPTSPDIL